MDKHYLALSEQELAHLMAALIALNAVANQPELAEPIRERDERRAWVLGAAMKLAGYEDLTEQAAIETYDQTMDRLMQLLIEGHTKLLAGKASPIRN